jgi:hypothetical protein
VSRSDSAPAPTSPAAGLYQSPDGPLAPGYWGLLLRASIKAALLLLAVCLLAYGPMLKALGFYWDDWPGMMVTNYLTHQDVREYVSSDRPVSGFVFNAVSPLLGRNPWRAHVAALLLRWLISLGVWWIVVGVWPGRWFEAQSAAVLVAIYPGYGEHAIAWIHDQGLYLPLVLTLFSLACSIWIVRVPRLAYFLLVPALGASILSTFVVEYFVGLELVRPVLLGVAMGATPNRFHRIIRAWLPYIPILILWFVWRTFFFHSTRQATDQGALFSALARHPAQQIGQRILYAMTDLAKGALMAWSQAVGSYVFNSPDHGTWLKGLAILGATAVLTAAWLRRSAKESGEGLQWGVQAMAIGFLAMCAGGLPVWAANRHVVLGDLSDRYSTPLMFGACLIAVGLIRWVLRTPAQQVLATAFLVGFGAVFQFRTEATFAADWQLQRQLLWQLKWRAPGLESGTAVLLVDDSALNPKSNYSIAVPLNLMYAGPPSSRNLPYWAFHTPRNDPDRYRLAFEKDTAIEGKARSLVFHGTTSDALSIWYHPPSCLQVLSPADAGLLLPEDARTAASLSHRDRILTRSSTRPDSLIFGAEPGLEWCYYFEKAELARQFGDWSTIARLGDEVRHVRLQPAVAAEWKPFIEAYTKLGRFKDAAELVSVETLARLAP